MTAAEGSGDLRAIVKEALHTVAMECGPFTVAERAEFDKIAAGTKTTDQYRTEILAELAGKSRKNGENKFK